MATRGNFVSLYGYVYSIKVSPEANMGLALIAVTRSARPTGDERGREVDLVTVMTNKPDQILEMMRWQRYDIVEIKGVISTISNGSKKHICSDCGKVNTTIGTAAYVYPQFLRLREHFDGDDDSKKNQCALWLGDNREVSNIFNCFAYLCKEPKRKSLNRGLDLTEYQVVIHRAYRIAEDDPAIKDDFVWVKSYGKTGMEDARRLHVSSQIYIDGLLQSRQVKQKATCAHCGAFYNWTDRVLEIVPYNVQYVSNCYNEDEAQDREDERTRQQAQSVLATLKGAKAKKEDAFSGIDFGEGMQTDD